jgi:hypothetical protein
MIRMSFFLTPRQIYHHPAGVTERSSNAVRWREKRKAICIAELMGFGHEDILHELSTYQSSTFRLQLDKIP